MEKGGRATFFSDCASPALQERIRSAGASLRLVSGHAPDMGIDVLLQQAAMLDSSSAFRPWVVFDGYHLGAPEQQRVKDAGLHLLCMDDMAHSRHYSADVVVNPNPGVSEALYSSRDPSAELLLGAKYAILRREFRRIKGWTRRADLPVRHVLITFGGADPDDFTSKALAACDGFRELTVRAVAGATNRHVSALRRWVQQPGRRAQLLVAVDNMPELMQWADVAISAAGQTCWELAFLGLPSLVMAIVDNQISNAEFLQHEGLALHLRTPEPQSSSAIAQALQILMEDPAARLRMALRGPAWVDGRGGGRVVDRMREKQMVLRSACAEDCRWLFELANDPGVRRFSFSESAIPWEAHVSWFQRKLAKQGDHFLVVESERAEPMGSVRLDDKGAHTLISIGLREKFRGQGWGALVIRKACRWYQKQAGAKGVQAGIRVENKASIRAFEAAGFIVVDGGEIQGHPAVLMNWSVKQ